MQNTNHSISVLIIRGGALKIVEKELLNWICKLNPQHTYVCVEWLKINHACIEHIGIMYLQHIILDQQYIVRFDNAVGNGSVDIKNTHDVS